MVKNLYSYQLRAGKPLQPPARPGNEHPSPPAVLPVSSASQSGRTCPLRPQAQLAGQRPSERTCPSRAQSSRQEHVTGRRNEADCLHGNGTLCGRKLELGQGTGSSPGKSLFSGWIRVGSFSAGTRKGHPSEQRGGGFASRRLCPLGLGRPGPPSSPGPVGPEPQ